MNDFEALQQNIKEAIINQDLPNTEKSLSKRQIHNIFLKKKKARKVAKLSRRKNRN